MIPLEYYLLVAGVMFVIGSIGFFVRRNLLIQLMCIELLLNSINLTLVARTTTTARFSPSSSSRSPPRKPQWAWRLLWRSTA